MGDLLTPIHAGAALDEFRKTELAGAALLRRLRECEGYMLIDLPVGVGKSTALDNIIDSALSEKMYDLIVVLCPTRQSISERRAAQQPLASDTRILHPRPEKLCGVRDTPWTDYEQRGLSLYGKQTLCSGCPNKLQCKWPDQYTVNNLRGARLVFATQAQLERDPAFVRTMIDQTGATSCLVLIDENNMVLSSRKRSISAKAVEQFIKVLQELQASTTTHLKLNEQWVGQLEMIRHAGTDDLCAPGWQFPVIDRDWALEVQTQGIRTYGEDFRFIANELRQFCTSTRDSRERADDGAIRFAVQPRLKIECTDVVVFSATTIATFAAFRLGVKLTNPFEGTVFKHPETRWLNLASLLGAGKFFPSNAKQILDFFADLVVQRDREGKRCLLIAKEKTEQYCADEMQKRFTALGAEHLKVVLNPQENGIPSGSNTVPIIHYGVIGTNHFEDYDCAFCLNSYYVNEAVVDTVIQDFVRTRISTSVRKKNAPASGDTGAQEIAKVGSVQPSQFQRAGIG